MKRLFFFALIAITSSLNAFSQDKDSDFKIKLDGRVQTRAFVALADDSNQVARTGLGSPSSAGTASFGAQVRRARIGASGYLMDNKFYFRIQTAYDSPEFQTTQNANFALLDAFAVWQMNTALNLKFGQFILPGNLERTFTSRNQQFVEQSILSRRFALNRDIGIQLQHNWKIGSALIKEYAFIGNGEGLTPSNEFGTLQYVGRLELLPFGDFENKGSMFMSDLVRESQAKLLLGASYSFNDNTSNEFLVSDAVLSPLIQRDVITWEIDALLKWRGLSIYSQFVEREVAVPAIYDENLGLLGYFDSGNAFSVQAGYLLPNDYEISLRYTDIYDTPDLTLLSNSDLREYSLAFSKYIKLHNIKFQTDLSYLDLENPNSADVWMFRAQIEIGF